MPENRDSIRDMIADGVPLDAKQRYAFQLIETVIVVTIRCKCRPNQVMNIVGTGGGVTCDHCGFQYSIHQVIFNRDDAERRGEIGVAINAIAPKIARPTFVEPHASGRDH